MAIIPKKSKTNNVSDSISLEIGLVLLSIYLITDSIFSRFVVGKLSLVFGGFIVLTFIYLLLGSKKNKGCIGYERIIIYLKYLVDKTMEWKSKHIYKSRKNEDEKNKKRI